MRVLSVIAIATLALPIAAERVDTVAMYNRAAEITGGLQRAWPGCLHANVSVLDPIAGWQHGAVDFCWARHALAVQRPKTKAVSGLKTEVSMPAMRAGFLQRGGERLRWGDDGEMNFALATALDRLYGIYYKQAKPGEKVIVRKHHLGKQALLCASIGNVRYFCGDAATGNVRSVMVPGGEMEIAIDALDLKDGVPYVKNASVLYFGKPIVRIEVAEVRKVEAGALTETFKPAENARPARFDQVARVEGPVEVSQGVLSLDHDRAARATLMVGADGRARDVRILAASDDGFGREFAKALMRARYTPSKEHGVAVDSVLSASVYFPKTPPPRNNGDGLDSGMMGPRETYLSSWEHAGAEFENGGHSTAP